MDVVQSVVNHKTQKNMQIYLKNNQGYLSLHYNSKYATGSIPVNDPQSLIKAIEEVCGRGSYCLYSGKSQTYTEIVVNGPLDFKGITYWQQGVKTGVIEQARDVASQVWGNIPEMKIGWIERQCKSYIEDLQISPIPNFEKIFGGDHK